MPQLVVMLVTTPEESRPSSQGSRLLALFLPGAGQRRADPAMERACLN